ncbi:MAG: response regulator [Acidobacteria bacterium]|nr:response regulator [Acidobacteriota bacterium]
MGKTLSQVLTTHRNLLQEQILASANYNKTDKPSVADANLTILIQHILDLVIEQIPTVNEGLFGHKLIELTRNDEQICLPGLGPALSNLRNSVFSLLAKELPQNYWSTFYLHLSSGIDACLLSDNTLAEVSANPIKTVNRLLAAEAQTKREISINTINRAINSSLELSEIIKSVAYELSQMLGVAHLAVYRATSEKLLTLEHEFIRQKSNSRVHDLLISTENPLIKPSIENKATFAVSNIEAELLSSSLGSNPKWLKSRAKVMACLTQAIFINNKFWGVLYLTEQSKRDWTSEDISLVETIADQLTIAIRQAELFATIARTNQEWTSTFDAISDAIFILDRVKFLHRANKAASQLLGKPLLEIMGSDSADLHPIFRDTQNLLSQVISSNQSQTFEQTYGDPPRSLLLKADPIKFTQGESFGVVCVLRDITSNRPAPEQVIHTDKLHSLGQMASGVAHDFNNVLATILGRTQLLKRLAESDQIRRGLEIIETAALDGAATARRIQNFARLNPTNVDFNYIDLNQLITDSLEFTTTRWNSDAHAKGINFEVTTSLTPSIGTLGDASELREVFVNLIFNAVDAMPKGGKLHISSAIDSNYAVIKVSDNGIGMSSEIKNKIFEPFFTTKGSSGTGLGLSVSLSIIAHHNGTIEIDSEPGKGTTFFIRLPLVENEPAAITSSLPTTESMPCAKILIVDDEDSVREVLADILDIFGHTIVSCASAQEGLNTLETTNFDIIFTDLAMPDMDGWALAEKVRQKFQQIKIVLMTGYGADTNPENQNKVDAIVSKPFEIEQLRVTLVNLLRH